jgi:hypothetical protein
MRARAGGVGGRGMHASEVGPGKDSRCGRVPGGSEGGGCLHR